jgi:hypothetical protein
MTIPRWSRRNMTASVCQHECQRQLPLSEPTAQKLSEAECHNYDRFIPIHFYQHTHSPSTERRRFYFSNITVLRRPGAMGFGASRSATSRRVLWLAVVGRRQCECYSTATNFDITSVRAKDSSPSDKTTSNLPLSGVRILELGQLIAGPFTGQQCSGASSLSSSPLFSFKSRARAQIRFDGAIWGIGRHSGCRDYQSRTTT